MIIVTGGAGFIGSNIVKQLNHQGEHNILVVDNVENTAKISNLAGLSIADYMDKQEFYQAMLSGSYFDNVSAVFHQGACSDTMASDGRYVLHNNFTYSKAVFRFCQQHNAQFLYASSASVYGSGTTFVESPKYESTLNAYAYSKLLFDNFIRRQENPGIQYVGLRYFNVYGPGEQHKGRMASVAWHFRNQYNEHGKLKLFQGSSGYDDGEQRRDFVSVEDVVKVNMFYLQNPKISGIFNVGTGKCQSFNDVAMSVLAAMFAGKVDSDTVDEQVAQQRIEYIPMPDALHGKYQSYTEADLSNLRASGYQQRFLTVQEGVIQYLNQINREN